MGPRHRAGGRVERRRAPLTALGIPEGRSSATGFVVAGGQSRRMGRDKALAGWGDITLLDHAVARLRECCEAVRILCGPQLRYQDRGLAVEVDVVRGAGAIAGILTGLLRADSELGLFLAVDMPRVSVALLSQLVDLAEGHDAVVPVSPAGPEPLCAVYRTSCATPIAKRLEREDYRATSFLEDVRVRWIGPEQVRAWGEPIDAFANVNTPADLEAAQRGA